MVDHRDDGGRLESAERRLEDLTPERIEIARDGHQHRRAARLEEGREEHVIAGDERALAAALPEARRGPREQRAEDGGVLVQPRPRVDETVTSVEDVQPADQRELRDESVERARVRASAREHRLEPVEKRVLGVTQHHLDLLGGHRGEVARLFAEEQIRRRLPLAEGHVAQNRDDRCRGHNGGERENREPRRRRAGADYEPPSTRSRRITASVSA